jgi:acetolactate synthase I/II/III large subunit
VNRAMTGGQAVVESLLAQGIGVLFGLPGIQNDWLYNALYDAGGRIRVIHTRHEQGAGYMALGYALAGGEIGVCNVVPGPGVLNAGAALATAYALGARVLFLVGQIPLGQIGRGLGVLHETPDQPGLLRSLTKLSTRIEHPSEAPVRIAEAMAHLKGGRPRPVAVEVPMDVLAQRCAVELAIPRLELAPPPLDTDAIEAAAKLIGTARSPMIFVGAGAQDAAREVTALAELVQAPVVAYRTGRGVVDSRNPLSCVLPEGRALWPGVDLAIALGCSARSAHMSWGLKERKLVRVDVDPAAHARFAEPAVGIVARLEEALPALLSAVPRHNLARPSRAAEMAEVHAAWAERSAVLEPQIAFLRAIRAALGEDGIFVDELTQVGFAGRIVMPVHRPRTFISTGYMGTLGYGFPTALGLKVARPDRRVLAVTGDGGFLFAASELATAVQHGIRSVTVLFNNGEYGNVGQMQRQLYGGRLIASELRNPDFERFVTSFGAHYARADDPQDLGRALESAFGAREPAVIEVRVGEMPSVDRFR